jgi:hypothetical protein
MFFRDNFNSDMTMGGVDILKIYSLSTINTGFETLVLENNDEVFPKYFNPNFNGHVIDKWGEVKVRTHRKGKRTDAPSFLTGMPIISRRAAEVFSEHLHEKIQILPLTHEQHEYVIVNVINVIDALDYNHAEIKRFTSGNIQDIVTYSFHPHVIQNELIFKIPEYPQNKIFVTDSFREIIEANKLIGFRFDLIWNSEEAQQNITGPRPKDIPELSTNTYSYREAAELLLAGKAIASGVWKIQQDNTGNVMLGEWIDGYYHWIDPIFFPPIFHELTWSEVERSLWTS